MRNIILLSVIFACASFAHAQTEKVPTVHLIARATENSIKLRWAPSNSSLWHLANKYGYTIERVTISENNKLLKDRGKVTLTKAPLKPMHEEAWDNFMDTDDFVAISAQALFGETFEMTNGMQSPIVKVVTKSREVESRFSFHLFSVDQSINAARLSGLYYEDETIGPDTRYLYRVYANIPTTLLKADTGFYYIGLKDYHPLPAPVGVNVEFGDRSALINWNADVFAKTYNSYWVEKSDDKGKSFTRITDRPVINTHEGPVETTPLLFWTDSLLSNSVHYQYRVIGVNAFGELSPPSEIVEGSGKPLFSGAAIINKHEVTADGSVSLSFTFPENQNANVKAFELLRGDAKGKTTERLAQITVSDRIVVDRFPKGSNYYQIVAHDHYGQTTRSFPYFVQLEDSIPPEAPTGLVGRIDTSGLVFLTWRANDERDILGYYVYRANFTSEEFVKLPGKMERSNRYVDTISLKNLSEIIHYRVVAVDKRFNNSKFSVVLSLEKPDLVPPVPPSFTSVKNDSLGISLAFVRSGSNDVREHYLYRRNADEADWSLISSFADTSETITFIDREVDHRQIYEYTVLAIDDDQLESLPSIPVRMKRIENDAVPPIKSIYAKLDDKQRRVVISWDYTVDEVKGFAVYKSRNGGPLMLLKTVSALTREFVDEYALTDQRAVYCLAAVFTSGEISKISHPVALTF